MIIRQPPMPTERYVAIHNAWMRDVRLSRRARGLLAELLTHEDGWQTTLDELVRKGPEGRDAISKAIRELTTLGYLVIHQERAHGRMGEVTYTINEPASPGKENQWAANQWAVDQQAENQWAYKKTNSKKTTKKTTTRIEPPQRKSAAATTRQQRCLQLLLNELERQGALIGDLSDIRIDDLTSAEASAAIKDAKRELYHLGGNPDRLGEAFPDLQAEFAGDRERAS